MLRISEKVAIYVAIVKLQIQCSFDPIIMGKVVHVLSFVILQTAKYLQLPCAIQLASGKIKMRLAAIAVLLLDRNIIS